MDLEALKTKTLEGCSCIRVDMTDLTNLLLERDRLRQHVQELQELANKNLLELRSLRGGDARAPDLKEVLAKAVEVQLSEEQLDEHVHDFKSHEASEVNNGGREEQIAYLLHVLGRRRLLQWLESQADGG